MIDCPYWTNGGNSGGNCAIGRFGGKKISPGTCGQCIAKGENTPEHAAGIVQQASFRVGFRKKGCKTCKPKVITYRDAA